MPLPFVPSAHPRRGDGHYKIRKELTRLPFSHCLFRCVCSKPTQNLPNSLQTISTAFPASHLQPPSAGQTHEGTEPAEAAVLKGHGFSRAVEATVWMGALQAGEKLRLSRCFERARFQPCRKCNQINAGFSPCRTLLCTKAKCRPFSATSSTTKRQVPSGRLQLGDKTSAIRLQAKGAFVGTFSFSPSRLMRLFPQ